ncbi:MAG TPA: hypothetical protein V6C86_24335 [Oculatellaceae cyanobacterium]
MNVSQTKTENCLPCYREEQMKDEIEAQAARIGVLEEELRALNAKYSETIIDCTRLIATNAQLYAKNENLEATVKTMALLATHL